MQFQPPLQRATLVRRYKRFLADIETSEGQALTIHCPNTGAMTGCAEPGFQVWYSISTNAKRKYPHTWELSENFQQELMVVNTQRANQLAELAVVQQRIPQLTGYEQVQREVKYGDENSRIDLLLTQHPAHPDCFIEVKSVTLKQAQQGYFPDAVTLRGQKHLRELIATAQAGHRAALLFMVAHTGISSVKPAAHIDPEYAKLCTLAKQSGVEFFALSVDITSDAITPGQLLDVILEDID